MWTGGWGGGDWGAVSSVVHYFPRARAHGCTHRDPRRLCTAGRACQVAATCRQTLPTKRHHQPRDSSTVANARRRAHCQRTALTFQGRARDTNVTTNHELTNGHSSFLGSGSKFPPRLRLRVGLRSRRGNTSGGRMRQSHHSPWHASSALLESPRDCPIC